MRIALIDPDVRHAEFVNRLLFAGGHLCHLFRSSAGFLDWLGTETCDLFLVASWAGDLPAEEVIPRARLVQPGVPAIAVMSEPRESEIVACLQAGADDCIRKPVRGPELLARVSALMRRAGVQRPHNRPRDTFGEYSFDSLSSIVRFGTETVLLTPKEFRFALLLFANKSRPVSRVHILESVWEKRRGMKSRTLDTHASRLRSKLRLHPERGYRLTPLYGYGYQLDTVPVDPARKPRSERV
ncbi:response regulator transcription factor [Burkholderia alba]|uniref:response regulator transcription factor n=1 Tax=Burkholderia alba TaxID=2683677 RepID=UPI002B057E92|nr:response regulator transcription factor [Burkholderia alba]